MRSQIFLSGKLLSQAALALALSSLMSASALAQVTVRTVLETGPSEERFDMVVLGEGYLASDQARFNQDVDALLAALVAQQPFSRYINYFNIRSGFVPSQCHVGACSQFLSTTYNAAFLPDNTQVCGNLDPAMPIDIPLAQAHAQQVGEVDPGGLIVLIHSPAGPEIKYGGIAIPGVIAVATNNLQPRTNYLIPSNIPSGSLYPDLTSLKFPEIVLHELGHSIGGLADETGTFGALPGCPLPEPNANDFLEVNVSRFSNRSRFFRWSTQFSISTVPEITGGLGFYGNCWPTQTTWPVYHMMDRCMMNLLNSDYCAVCREELAIQIHEQAELGPNLLSPVPGTTDLTPSDGVTLGFEDLTIGGAKDARWFLNGSLYGVGPQIHELSFPAPPSSILCTLEVTDEGHTGGATSPRIISNQELSRMRTTVDWTLNPVPEAAAGEELQTAIGGSPGFMSGRLGRNLTSLGDLDGDGVEDLGITSPSHVFGMSGRTGASLFSLTGSCSTCWDPLIAGYRDTNNGNTLVAVAGLGHLEVDVYDHTGSGLSFVRTINVSHHPFSMANVGDVDLDGVEDFAVAGVNNVEVFSGSSGARFHIVSDGWRTPSELGQGDLIVGLGTDGGPPASWDNRPDYVVLEEAQNFGVERFVRCRSGRFGNTLWTVELPDSVEAHLAATGDVDGDGLGDFLLAIPEADFRIVEEAGSVTLRSGLDGSVIAEMGGSFNGKQLGLGMAGLGDVDGDSVPDFALARISYPAGLADRNLVDVISGASLATIATFPGTHYGHGLRAGIAGIGDVNGDQIRDIAIADQYNNNTGRVRIFSVEPLQLATATILGTGCVGSTGVSQLTPIDVPALGSSYDLQLTNLPANTAAFGFVSFTEAMPPMPLGSIGMPGCSSFLAGQIASFALPVSGTTASWTLPIPNDPTFIGLTILTQGFVLDPGANPMGAIVTNGVKGVVGF